MTDAEQVWVGVMKKMALAAIPVLLVGAIVWPAARAVAQSSSAGIKVAQAVPQQWIPRHRRPVPRLRVTPYPQQGVIPHYDPGPDAVRVCNAHYEQEYRPSGTVIVPKMRCHWTRG